jgi:hypothetical protein
VLSQEFENYGSLAGGVFFINNFNNFNVTYLSAIFLQEYNGWFINLMCLSFDPLRKSLPSLEL